ncbi:MAG: IS3 family transposase [Bacilli bacterium]
MFKQEESTTEEKVSVVNELRLTYPLKILLKISGLKRSTFYYTVTKIDKDNKNKDLMEQIKDIFNKNKATYGYRRITLELKNRGFIINHKKVLRLMNKYNLFPIVRRKRKYSWVHDFMEELE